MAGVMSQLLPAFFVSYNEKALFLSTMSSSFENFLLTTEYCVAEHNNNFCPLAHCKYHILLLSTSNIDHLLEQLENFKFSYQSVDCFYTLFKHQFNKNVIVKNGNVFDIVQRAVNHNSGKRSLEKTPSIAKKRLSRKKFRNHLSSMQLKCQEIEPDSLVFLDRVEKVRRTKYDIELLKILDCFINGCGTIDSSRILFQIKN